VGFLINSAFAFIGGVVLNFMPCVFPVLSLKAAAIINYPGNSFKLKLNGIAYTLGVLTSKLMLSLTLLTLRNIGYAMDWGFHTQSPVLVLVLLYIMFVIGLCFLCSLSDISLIFSRSDKVSSSFFGGMLLTLVAIPCVTPFMAPAIGFALIQPSIFTSISIFLFLGLGIALPYFIVSFFPNTLEFLPKPGEWTAALKHFPLFSVSLSIIWLFWMLTKESNTVPILTGLLSSAFSVWIWIFNDSIKPLIKPVISTLFLRLIHYRSSYPRQRKKSPFKATHKPRK
jgi:thiol:disulfide interchange protein DsbD